MVGNVWLPGRWRAGTSWEPQLGEAAAGSELAKLRSGDTTAAAAESSGVGEELRSFSGAAQEPRSPGAQELIRPGAQEL